MIDVLCAVQDIGDPEETHQGPEDQEPDQAQDQSKKVSGGADPILQNGLHLSSLAVGDHHGVVSELDGCQNCCWRRCNDCRSGLLLHLRRWRLYTRGGAGETDQFAIIHVTIVVFWVSCRIFQWKNDVCEPTSP